MSNLTHPNDADEPEAGLTPVERDWEAALSSLRPAGAGGATSPASPTVAEGPAFRDQVMFRAGEAAGRCSASQSASAPLRQVWAWRAATAALFLIALGLAVRGRTPVERVRVVIVPASRPASGPAAPSEVGPVPTVPDQVRATPTGSGDSPGPADWPEPPPVGPSAGSPPAQLVGLSGPSAGYLHTREVVLRWGVRALPGPAAGGSARSGGSAGPEAEPPTPRTWAGVAGQAVDPAPPASTPRAPARDEMRRLRRWLFPGVPAAGENDEMRGTEGDHS